MLQTRTNRIRLLIAEHRALVREGMRAVLQLADEFEIVGEAESGQQAVRMVHRLGPDVVVIGVMPEQDGIATIGRIREERPATRVVALSTVEPNDVVAVMRAGASGCVSLENRAQDLRHTINAAAAGQVELPSRVMASLVCERFSADADHPGGLSARELDVLQLLATGATNRAIGSALCISEKTVKNHVSNIFYKLDVQTRTQAALFAREMRSNRRLERHV
jgi:DNA-binding NarL/FixJ family response regulator